VIPTVKNYIKQRLFRQTVAEKSSAEAYNLWSANYDAQPGNLMMDLDEVVFPKLLEKAAIRDKEVADIGCGTGRHWYKLFQLNPASLTGFDVSEGMLNRLQQKFPGAHIHRIMDDLFSDIPDATYDTIVSTLTVAHIGDIEQAMQAWCRILKPQAEIIITDFHPKLLAFGGKRTFKHNNTSLAVRNFVHSTNTIKDILHDNGFSVIADEEISIDETVKHYYTQKNALNVYEQFKGFPVIYGIHLKRNNAPE
jgi:ubiquinone/menaquinone biosynthesis C-methylase UbiE